MLSAGVWEANQENTILFVLVNSDGSEVNGLGSSFTVELSKGLAAFAAGGGTKGEIGSGWYYYTATVSEANTAGPVAVKVTGSGVLQQNLEYIVQGRTMAAVELTYTITDQGSGDPIDGVEVWIATDTAGANIVWHGYTDASGVARDEFSNLPRLDPGTYQVFRSKSGWVFDDPDQEVVA